MQSLSRHICVNRHFTLSLKTRAVFRMGEVLWHQFNVYKNFLSSLVLKRRIINFYRVSNQSMKNFFSMGKEGRENIFTRFWWREARAFSSKYGDIMQGNGVSALKQWNLSMNKIIYDYRRMQILKWGNNFRCKRCLYLRNVTEKCMVLIVNN